MKIDGKLIASEILSDLKARVDVLKDLRGITPHLYVILLINDASTLAYIKQKKLRSEEIGAKITIDDSTPNITTDELLEKIEELNNDKTISGIIVQRPLPKNLDEEKITNAVSIDKDVDGFNPNSKFKIPVGLAILEILKNIHKENFKEWLSVQRIAVIGKGLTAGGPIIKTFRKLGLNPQVISSQTENRKYILKNSNIVVSAVGKAGIVKSEDLKQGVILIGVGMHTENGKLKGDYNETEIESTAGFYTPTPGGVGPVNVASLMRNLVESAENQSA